MAQTTHQPSSSIAYLGAHQPLPVFADLAVRTAVVVTKWRMRRDTRRALAQLETHLLKDVGLTPKQVRLESGLWFWQS